MADPFLNYPIARLWLAVFWWVDTWAWWDVWYRELAEDIGFSIGADLGRVVNRLV